MVFPGKGNNRIKGGFFCICWLLYHGFNRWSLKREAHIKKQLPEHRGKQVVRENIKQGQGDPNKTHSPAPIQMSQAKKDEGEDGSIDANSHPHPALRRSTGKCQPAFLPGQLCYQLLISLKMDVLLFCSALSVEHLKFCAFMERERLTQHDTGCQMICGFRVCLVFSR